MNQVTDKETQKIRAKYNRNARFYNLMEFPMEALWYRKWRRQLFDKVLTGQRILEVGVGTGKNLSFYPDKVKSFGIDLSEGMFSKAIKKARQQQLTLAQADVQNLPYRDNSFDLVVATFVFCSVPEPVVGLQEIARVLKNGGQLLLLEHVLPQNPVLARLFNWLDGWTVRSAGVHINRKSDENIRQAGFEMVAEQNLLATIYKYFKAKPHLNGRH